MYESIYLCRAVVRHEPDAHRAAALGEPERFDGIHRIEVATPGLNTECTKRTLDRIGVRKGRGERDDGGALIESIAVGDAAHGDPGDRLQPVEKLRGDGALMAPDRPNSRTNRPTTPREWGGVCRASELLANPGEVVDRGGDPGHPLEARRPGLPLVVGGSHLISAVALKELEAPEEQASMGSVELVRGAEQEVRVECLHINGVVRCAAHRIEDGERSHLMCEAHDLF